MALLAPWLADFQLLAAALLLGVMLAIALLRQPAHRLAVAKSTLVALAALALLCAIPGWSLVHLLNEPSAPAPLSNQALLIDVASTPPAPAPLPFEPIIADPSPTIATIAEPPTPLPADPINWPTAIVTLYAVGCGLVTIWLAIGGLLARRVLNQARPAPPELEQLLAQITGPVARSPRLLISKIIAAPVAMGLRRPAILLPLPGREGLGEGFANHPLQSESQLLPILAHEWAHLEHRDLHTLAATRLLLILLWPQPLFWLLRRTIRLDQETLADAAAADRAGRLDYAQQLLAWARTASTQRPPRLAGAVGLWEGPSQLKRRIAVLLNEKFSVMRSCSAAWRRACVVSLAIAAITLSLVTLQPTPVVGNDDATDAKPAAETADIASDNKALAPTAEQPADFTIDPAELYEEAGAAEPNTYAGICVDEQGAPLPGVEVSLFVYGNFDLGNPPAENVEPAAVMTADAVGRFRFEDVVELAENHAVDAASKQIAVIAQAPGRATGGSLESISLVASRGKTSRLPLVSAAKFSGRVTDFAGNPIADAVVATNWGYLIPNAGLLTRTDAEGRFHLDSMPPATPVVPASVVVTHPDYVAKFAKQASNSTDFDVKLRHGSIVTGRVVYQPADRNEPSFPIAGVRVWAAGSRPVVANDEEDGQRIAVTDAEGRYELRGLVGGTYAVNASTPDRVTEGLAGIEVNAKSLPMEPDRTVEVPDMVLTDGAIVRMKFVDAATGKPLATARGAQAHITPRRIADVERPYGFRIARPIDEQAETELRLPAGKYSFFTLLPAGASGVVWTSVSEKVSTADGEAEFVDVVEGATVEITVPMSSYSPADVYNPVSEPSPSLDLQIPSQSPYYAPQPTGVGVSGAPAPLYVAPTAPPTTISAPQAGVASPATATTGDGESQAKEVAERGSALVKQLAHSPNLFMGFCIDEAGEPLADVDVSLFVYEGATANENVEPIARVRTGADGKFEFDKPVDVAKEFPNGVPEDQFATPPIKIIAAVAKAPGLTTEFKNDALYRFVKQGQVAILQMKPAQKLTGQVTGDNRQPVAGAIVTATMSGGYVPGGNLSARTDSEGRYSIDNLPRFDVAERDREYAAARERKEPWALMRPPGPMLSVQHPGFAAHRVSLEAIPGEIDVTLHPGVTVTGRVVAKSMLTSDDVRPLANAPVWITRLTVPIVDPRASYALVEQQQEITDAEGNYTFTSLPAGSYSLTATAPNLTTVGVTGVGGEGGKTTVARDVVLTPGAIVRVKLLDAATKQPLKLRAGQKGYVIPKLLTPGALRNDSTITTFTADGVGETRLAPGRYELFVSIPGEGLAPNLESHSPDGKSTVGEFEVREGETLELDVPLIAFPLQMASGVTATVQPAVADGAVVETQEPAMGYFQSSETPADGEQPGVVPVKTQSDAPVIEGPNEQGAGVAPPTSGQNTPSNDFNAYWNDVPDSPWRLTPATTPLAEVAAGGDATPLQSAADLKVVGRCIDEAGAPIADARLWLPLRPEFLDYAATLETVADHEGNFSFTIPAKLRAPSPRLSFSRIFAYKPSYAVGVASAHKQLLAGDPSSVDVRLPAESPTTYRILDPGGDPLANARVEPWHLPAGDIFPEGLRQLLQAKSDSLGFVTLQGVRQSDIRGVRVHHADWGEQEFGELPNRRGKQSNELRLSLVGGVKGRVVSESNGPVVGIPVYAITRQDGSQVEGEGDGYAKAVTDAEGRFEIPAIAVGSGSLSFYVDQNQPWRVRTKGRILVKADEVFETQASLEKAVRVTGEVRTADTRQSVPAAQVHIRHGDLSNNYFLEQTLTDQKGQFEAFVLPGEIKMYLLQKSPEFEQWACLEQRRKTPIVVSAGHDAFKLPPMELERMASVEGSIVDGDDQPIAEMRLYGVEANYIYGNTVSDEAGRFVMQLPPSVTIEGYVARTEDFGGQLHVEVESESPLKLRVPKFRASASPKPGTRAETPADQGAATWPRLAPIIFKPVEPPPGSPTLQATAGRAAVQSADIQAVSIIDRTKPLNYSAWEFTTQPAPIDLNAPATLGDAVK